MAYDRSVIASQPLHRAELGWRRRHAFGALGLRPPLAEHSEAEAYLLQHHARGAHTIVEIGVAEGGSALELRQVMDPDGRIVLIDPYVPGALGISFARLVARRAVRRCERGTLQWIRATSSAAASSWSGEIDFLFIDGDHSEEGVREDWRLWSPLVRLGGHVALHDARTAPEGWAGDREWIDLDAGPVRLADEIRGERAWSLKGEAETTVVFRREAV